MLKKYVYSKQVFFEKSWKKKRENHEKKKKIYGYVGINL